MYLDLTPYQYAANNPIRFIDVNGDSIDVYDQNGTFLMTMDDGNEEVTGLYFQRGKKDKNGNMTYSGGISFGYNDAEEDRGKLMSGEMEFAVIDQNELEESVTAGISHDWEEGKLSYTWRESQKYGTRTKYGVSKGKMDYFKSSSIIKGNALHIIRSTSGEAVGYNAKDFGNFMWGMAGEKLGWSLGSLKVGAHVNNIIIGETDNMHTPNYEHKILDSSKDQRAIRNGYYFNRRPQIGGVSRPIISF